MQISTTPGIRPTNLPRPRFKEEDIHQPLRANKRHTCYGSPGPVMPKEKLEDEPDDDDSYRDQMSQTSFFPRNRLFATLWLLIILLLPVCLLIMVVAFFALRTFIASVVLYVLVMFGVHWCRRRLDQPRVRVIFWSYCLFCTVVLFAAAIGLLAPFYAKYKDVQFVVLGGPKPDGMRLNFRGFGETSFRVDLKTAGEEWQQQVSGSINETADYSVHAELTGLMHSTLYQYRVVFGSAALGPSGTFRTLPLPSNTTASFSFISTSCLKRGRRLGGTKLKGMKQVADRQPDLFLIIGDLIYADVPWDMGVGYGTRGEFYAREYRATLHREESQAALSTIPTLFMYDDHELVNNYGEGNQTEVWRTAISQWDRYVGALNPSSASADRTGYQYSLQAGPCDIFVLDTRYHRNEAKGVLIGSDQLAQVKNWLLGVNASRVTPTFKFIVSPSGITLNNPSTSGNWNCRCPKCAELTTANAASCPNERDNLLDFIEAQNIRGVIFVTGDVHHPGVFQLRPTILEVGASPMDALSTGVWKNQKDKTLFEKSGMDSVFAHYKVEGNTLTISIYGAGIPLQNQIVLIILAVLTGFWIFVMLVHCLMAEPLTKPHWSALITASLLIATCVAIIFNALPKDVFDNPIYMQQVTV
eukprot:g23655.t1